MIRKMENVKTVSRNGRIAEEIHKAVAKAISLKTFDITKIFVTITHVDLSPDKKNAKIFFTLFKDEFSEKEKVLAVLNQQAGALRMELASTVRLRVVPKLAFFYDDSLQRGRNVSNLIDQLAKKS